jgi:MoxR-like ATPase
LSRDCDVDFQRIPFTPDLLPADEVGTRISNQSSGSFQRVTGPSFANVILANEINRTPAGPGGARDVRSLMTEESTLVAPVEKEIDKPPKNSGSCIPPQGR